MPYISDAMPVLDACMSYRDAAFEAVEQEYGDFETFLTDGLDADARKLRANLHNACTWCARIVHRLRTMRA